MNERIHACALRRIGAAGVVLTLTACATPLDKPLAGYSCCNLRASAGWVSSNNVQGGDLIAAGTPIALTSIKRRFYAYGTVNGSEFGFRDDAAKEEADTLAWLQRIVVAVDPRPQIAAAAPEVRRAIGAARVVIGMTRAEVAMALGHPSPNDTPDLAAATWRYWTAVLDEPVDLHFADDGRLLRLTGKPQAVQSIEL